MSLTGLLLACERAGIDYEVGLACGDALVSRASSIAASNFLRSDCDVLLTFGGDVKFKPQDAINLCRKCSPEYAIIGALVMKRIDNPIPYCPMPPELIMQDNMEPVEIRWQGTGFTATHRNIFEDLAPRLPLCAQASDTPFWPFYQPMIVPDEIEGFIYLSEDWALAERASKLGYKSWIDPTIRVGHFGSIEVRVEDFLRSPRPVEQPVRWRTEEDGKLYMDVNS